MAGNCIEVAMFCTAAAAGSIAGALGALPGTWSGSEALSGCGPFPFAASVSALAVDIGA
jgi:hypothetical protein